MSAMDAGLLVLRLCCGLLMVGHAFQKATGWFGGDGFATMSAVFDRIGFSPGRVMVAAAVATELLGGVLLIVGLLTPLAGAILTGALIVAASVHWPNGLWGSKGGIELPLVLATVATSLALTGPGRISIDHLVGLYPAGWVHWAAAVLGIAAGGAFILAKPAFRRFAPR